MTMDEKLEKKGMRRLKIEWDKKEKVLYRDLGMLGVIISEIW